ncbi:MAG: nuclear transport factor 2 family protein [Acidimicrobiia bacterium]
MTNPSDAVFTADHLQAFFEACNAHDVDRIAGFFTPDGVYLASYGPDDDGTVYRGVDEVRRGFAAFFGTYPDGHYTDSELAVDGDRGLAKWTFTGTPAGGETMSYRGVDLFEFSGDRIALKDAFRKERARPAV